jgi:hypothetical protein
MLRTRGFAALAVLGLMLVAANAEVFFQEDFTGVLPTYALLPAAAACRARRKASEEKWRGAHRPAAAPPTHPHEHKTSIKHAGPPRTAPGFRV